MPNSRSLERIHVLNWNFVPNVLKLTFPCACCPGLGTPGTARVLPWILNPSPHTFQVWFTACWLLAPEIHRLHLNCTSKAWEVESYAWCCQTPQHKVFMLWTHRACQGGCTRSRAPRRCWEGPFHSSKHEVFFKITRAICIFLPVTLTVLLINLWNSNTQDVQCLSVTIRENILQVSLCVVVLFFCVFEKVNKSNLFLFCFIYSIAIRTKMYSPS